MSNAQKSETRVKMNNVRLVFPVLDSPEEYRPGDGKGAYYSLSALFPKDHPDLPALSAAVRAAAKAKWGEKAEAMLQVAKSKDKLPVHDGDMKASKSYGAEYAGKLYLSARNKAPDKPKLFDIFIDPATGLAREVKEAGKFYSGCRVNLILNVFGYSRDGGEGIGAGIAAVQFLRDDVRLAGGATASADEFDAVPEQAQKAAEQSGGGAAALF